MGKRGKTTVGEILEILDETGREITLKEMPGRYFIVAEVAVAEGRTVTLKIRNNRPGEYLVTDFSMLFKMINAYDTSTQMIFRAFSRLSGLPFIDIYGVEIVENDYASPLESRLTRLADIMDDLKSMLRGESYYRNRSKP